MSSQFVMTNFTNHEPHHITLRIAMHRNGTLQAFPVNQRVGLPFPVHTDRPLSGDRKRQGKALLKGLPGSEKQGRFGMPALPLNVHR